MKQFTLSMLLILIFSSSWGQEYSSFDYKKGNFASVFPMENTHPEEKLMLAFRFPSHFNLVFLDDSMRLKRMQKTGIFPAALWDKSTLATINHEKELYVFMPTETIGSFIYTDLYKFDKRDGSVEMIPIRLEDEQEKILSKGPVRLVKIFPYKHRFYKIWVNTKTSVLYIFYYETGKGGTMGFKSLPIDIDGIGRILSRKKERPTPVIRGDKDGSFVNKTIPEKIYMFEDEMFITVEDLQQGRTNLIRINTDTWDLSTHSYPVLGFKDKAKEQNFNSLIYKDFIFQVLYNAASINILKTNLETGALTSKIQWLNSEDFIRDFPQRKTRIHRINKLEVSEVAAPWQSFKKSIGIHIQAEDLEERLIIISQNFPNQWQNDEPNLYEVLSKASSIGGYNDGSKGSTFFGYGGGYSAFIDPFPGNNSLIDVSNYFSEYRAFQFDTYWDSKNFNISGAKIEPSRWERVMNKIQEEKAKHKLRSVSYFEHGDKAYLGYYKKRKYYILEF